MQTTWPNEDRIETRHVQPRPTKCSPSNKRFPYVEQSSHKPHKGKIPWSPHGCKFNYQSRLLSDPDTLQPFVSSFSSFFFFVSIFFFLSFALLFDHSNSWEYPCLEYFLETNIFSRLRWGKVSDCNCRTIENNILEFWMKRLKKKKNI